MKFCSLEDAWVFNKASQLPCAKNYRFFFFFCQGPDEWETLNGNWSCNGRKQSPIDVVTDQVMQKDPTNPPNLRLTVAGNKPITGEIRNNGYAPTFFVGEELTVKLAGGLLQESYFMKQFHFHFGCNDTVGSEHTIDGNTYPIEVKSDFLWLVCQTVIFPSISSFSVEKKARRLCKRV